MKGTWTTGFLFYEIGSFAESMEFKDNRQLDFNSRVFIEYAPFGGIFAGTDLRIKTRIVSFEKASENTVPADRKDWDIYWITAEIQDIVTTHYDVYDVFYMNEDVACGSTDWQVAVGKSIMNTECVINGDLELVFPIAIKDGTLLGPMEAEFEGVDEDDLDEPSILVDFSEFGEASLDDLNEKLPYHRLAND